MVFKYISKNEKEENRVLKFHGGKREPYNGLGRPWYDTKDGISRSIGSLESLLHLVYERHNAGYVRDERLNEFYLFGRFNLDCVGNCSKANSVIPKEIVPEIPDVLTREEFWDIMKEHEKDDIPMLSFSMSFNGILGELPLSGLKCKRCGRTWDIHNCFDTVIRESTEDFSLADFVGQTLGSVKIAFAQRDNAIYQVKTEIRNNRFINLSPMYPNPEDDWQKSEVINKHGWVGEKDGITDNYIIQPGDDGCSTVWTFFHHACNKADLREEKRKKFRQIFELAGFKHLRLLAIKNEYCTCDRCAPWFNVKTEFGIIKIGWRKRVINIDWSSVENFGGQLHKGILLLFTKEDVTKGDTYIHAWGWDDAQKYLTKIFNLLSK